MLVNDSYRLINVWSAVATIFMNRDNICHFPISWHIALFQRSLKYYCKGWGQLCTKLFKQTCGDVAWVSNPGCPTIS